MVKPLVKDNCQLSLTNGFVNCDDFRNMSRFQIVDAFHSTNSHESVLQFWRANVESNNRSILLKSDDVE